MTDDLFSELRTLQDLRDFVAGGYYGASHGSRLPLAVAEPGPLMERAVELAGSEGLSRQELHDLFQTLGSERRDRGMTFMRTSGRVSETTEKRPTRSGRMQNQVVFRFRGPS